MSGRLIGIVGPSGVGKDTVMRALSEARPELILVRRVITRAPGLGGEDYEAVSEAEFARRKALGAFCIDWSAHGLAYGIPETVRTRVADGEQMLVNLSRSVLQDVAAVISRFEVLNLTAAPETLAERLKQRGRENVTEIGHRLDRKTRPFPTDVTVHTIHNDGPLGETVRAALARLEPQRA